MINGINIYSENILTNLKVINCDELNTELISNDEINKLNNIRSNIQDQLDALPTNVNLTNLQNQINSINTTLLTKYTNGDNITLNNGVNLNSNILANNKIITPNILSYISNISSDVETQITENKNNISTINNNINNINNTLTSHTNSINSINNTLSSHTNSISNLDTKITELKALEISDIAAIGITTTGLQVEINTINTEIGIINSNLVIVDNDIETLQNKTQNIESILTNSSQTTFKNKINISDGVSNKIILDPNDNSYFGTGVIFNNNITQESGNFTTTNILGYNNNILNIGESYTSGVINLNASELNLNCITCNINGITFNINALLTDTNNFFSQW